MVHSDFVVIPFETTHLVVFFVEKEQELDRLKRKCASLQSRLDEKEHDKGGAGQQEVQAEHARLTSHLQLWMKLKLW